jgi:hypothetical protein
VFGFLNYEISNQTKIKKLHQLDAPEVGYPGM